MRRKVAVLTVHGINTSGARYSEPFKKNLLRMLSRDAVARVSFREVVWADIIRGRQDDYLNRATAMGLRGSWFRRLVVRALGDAAAYQRTLRRENSAYYDIQRRVFDQLKDFETGEDAESILIIVAHSLGSQIASSYAWDVNRWKQMPEDMIGQEPDAAMRDLIRDVRAGSGMRRLDTFGAFVTLGNNMPLFTFTFGPERVFPITKTTTEGWSPAFPGRLLPEAVTAKARWLNIYSPYDPLGYPLKPLNDSYGGDPRIEDIQMRVEGIGLMPRFYRAHVNYWKNAAVARKCADLIEDILH